MYSGLNSEVKGPVFETQKRSDSEGKVRHAIAEREPPR